MRNTLTTDSSPQGTQSYSLYGGEVILSFHGGMWTPYKPKHCYTVTDTKNKIKDRVAHGVTSVLGVIAKPALTYWAANCAAQYVEEKLPLGQAIDEVQKKELIEGAKKAHRQKLTKAGDYGTMLHEAIERHIKTGEIEKFVSPELQKGYSDFIDWAETNNVKFKASEKKVYSRKFNYAGTLDFIAEVRGKVVVGDLKTSSGIYDDYWLQLAAYKQCVLEENPGIKIDHTLIIRCGKDGAFEVKELNDFRKNMTAFLGALELFKWQKEARFAKYINQS